MALCLWGWQHGTLEQGRSALLIGDRTQVYRRAERLNDSLIWSVRMEDRDPTGKGQAVTNDAGWKGIVLGSACPNPWGTRDWEGAADSHHRISMVKDGEAMVSDGSIERESPSNDKQQVVNDKDEGDIRNGDLQDLAI